MNAEVHESTPPDAARPRADALRPRWWHPMASGALRAVTWLFGALPAPAAYLLADLFAVPIALGWSLSDRRGARVRGYWRNVRIVYRPGGLGPERPRGHLWRVARHLTWLAVDSCRLHRIRADTVDRVIDMREFAAMHALYAEGNGIIWATAHVGVWDVAGYVCALVGVPITSVFRPSPIPGVDRVIERLRTGSGQVVVAKQNVVGTLRRALARKETIGLLCDSAGRRGDAFPPFLGTPAATVATPALLQLSSGAPIVVVTTQRTGRFRFVMRIWDVIRPAAEPGADRDAEVRRILTRINAGLGRAVAEYPEQWFWQGRRFKHRPPGERPGADGLPPVAG
ncbi:MAG: lysophospholipid acyltransferase family protein [Planctomycetota bacterium]